MRSSRSDSTSSVGGAPSLLYPDINQTDIEIGPQLGSGTFGAVFSGSWKLPDGSQKQVALKKVFVLEKEAEILSKIRHKNIIQFYGICKGATGDFFIVTECAERGSLYDYIHSGAADEDTFETVLGWAVQIANGIHYLHYDAVDTIIHRDLKSKNVVLNKNLVCKICDFGTSKDLTHSCTAPSWGGTAAWMSPEMINQTDGLTTATDVWSYGVVVWEMLSKEVPYKDYTEYRIFSLITQGGFTLAIPDSCPNPLKLLMANCWKISPKERWNMKRILRELTMSEQQKNECELSLNVKDWQEEILKQERNVEKKRKELEKRKEQLENREKCLKMRTHVEAAVLASVKHPPEDVSQWNEHHTSHFVEMILSRNGKDVKFLNKVNTAIFRNRITGSRLIEMTQKDLDHLGVSKLGSRIELMREIRGLKEKTIIHQTFPTLHEAKMIEMKLKAEKEALLGGDLGIVLVLGIYCRKSNGNGRFKFFLDSDWADETVEFTGPYSTKNLIKSHCIAVFDAEGRPLNEPSFHESTSEYWIDSEDLEAVRCVVNVHFSDVVTQPRSAEIACRVESFESCRILAEKRVKLKTRRSPSSSTSTPSPLPNFHHTISAPHLRGFWHKKSTSTRHNLTETELAQLQESMRKSPRMIFEEEDEKNRREVHGGNDKWNWKRRPRPKFN